MCYCDSVLVSVLVLEECEIGRDCERNFLNVWLYGFHQMYIFDFFSYLFQQGLLINSSCQIVSVSHGLWLSCLVY